MDYLILILLLIVIIILFWLGRSYVTINTTDLIMTREEFRDKKSKDYRKHRESYGIKDPVYLDEIEEAYYQGMVDADTHPHWFSVEDCLPKIEEANCEWVGSEDVLALLWNGDMSVGRYERDNISGEYYWILYNVDKDHEVTHWMPLPSIENLKKGDKKNE